MVDASAAEARLAATVVLARDGADGPEVFMVRRHDRAHAVPSAFVFPGGTVTPADHALAAGSEVPRATLGSTLARRADAPPDPTTTAAVYLCAIRELLEEAGVLLARERPAGAGHLAPAQAVAYLAEARHRVQRAEIGLADVLGHGGWAADLDALVPFSHWVTPLGVPARYDTWFFVARMPADQEALHCNVETTLGEWTTPRALLARAAAGEVLVVFPTLRHLERIASFEDVDALLRFAATKSIRRVQPDLVEGGPHLAPDLVDRW